MCPNHVENFIDSNLVTSTSLTERLKLWNKYGGSKSGSGTNFNPDSIKLEFFRKVRKGKLYERGVNKSRVVNPAKRIRVPQYIKVYNQTTRNMILQFSQLFNKPWINYSGESNIFYLKIESLSKPNTRIVS